MPELELDWVDRRILAVLQSDRRLANVELAERVVLSPSLRRVRRLEEAGLIRRYPLGGGCGTRRLSRARPAPP